MITSSNFYTFPPPAHKWEAADEALKNAVESYLQSCLHLESSYLPVPKADKMPMSLVTRIDASLDILTTTLGRQLSRCHSSLARTRNRIASPIYNLPEEILAEISLNVVYMPAKARSKSLADTIHIMYRSLYNLIGVCSTWKNAIINCGALWAVVPVLDPLTRNSLKTLIHPGTDLSLQRAGRWLQLAADLSGDSDYKLEFGALASNVQRFHSVHIHTKSNKTITSLIRTILQSRSLAELSIFKRIKSGAQLQDITDHEELQIVNQQYTPPYTLASQPEFRTLMESITVLRLSGVLLPWDNIESIAQLQELHFRGVQFRSGDAMLSFLHTLSSGSELRDLTISSVSNWNEKISPPPSHAFTLAKLQSLALEDLTFHTLKSLLQSINPASYRTTLSITQNTTPTRSMGSWDRAHYPDLCDLIRQIAVDTLIIDITFYTPPPVLREILSSVPGLRVLRLNGWSLQRGDSEGLKRPEGHNQIPFPNLSELHLYNIVTWSADAAKAITKIQPIKRMVIGRDRGFDHYSLIELLKSVVPDVSLGDQDESESCWGFSI
ncbi:unnamed protein product [Rhizoctonia solani]|uniref:Uncharacterized protein n=1 Tax=Rhizoctonia solani TaxID=456999 RepID=A0A8H3HF70_9AGAM|nr:unnamed protein product [Rhizoctonia solani]